MSSYELSKKEVIKEIIKCGKDPIYFINNFCKISHPLQGLLSFKLYPFQEDCIRQFQDYRFNIVLKARQLGLSTATAGFIVWMMVFHREKTILTVATRLATASIMVKKVRLMYKNLPDWMKVLAKIDTDNKQTFELSNGSWIKASSTTGDSGRGDALSLLVVDEAATIPNMEEMWAGIYPTLSTGGRCIGISTPKNVGNWFHKTYTGAESGINNFNAIKLNWDLHPDRNQEWFENECKNMTTKDIAQELCCNFNFSGNTVVTGEDIEELFKGCSQPIRKAAFDRNLWIWKEPEGGKRYLLVADVARGDGEDSSAFHIIEVESMEQVAEYQGKISPENYALLLYETSKEYGFCLTVVENNTYGYSILEKLIEMKHPSIYYHRKTTNEFIEPLEGSYDPAAVPGFNTNQKMRPLAIAKMEEFIRNKIIKINSERLVNELRTFIWNNGRAEAMKSYNDDLCISCAIACWVREGALIISQRDIEYRKALIGGISMSNRKFNTTIPGMQGYENSDKQRKYNEVSKNYRDFSWLLK